MTEFIVPAPFRGDQYILQTATGLMNAGAVAFLETGAYYGLTVGYMAEAFPDKSSFSCEIVQKRFDGTKDRLKDLVNSDVFNVSSIEFLRKMEGIYKQEHVLVWLDAHDYTTTPEDWPIREEVKILSSWKSVDILIDDAQVPGRPWFPYDSYGGQALTYEYISPSLDGVPHEVWYPTYGANVNWWLRGWMLIRIGQSPEWKPDPWLELQFSSK